MACVSVPVAAAADAIGTDAAVTGATDLGASALGDAALTGAGDAAIGTGTDALAGGAADAFGAGAASAGLDSSIAGLGGIGSDLGGIGSDLGGGALSSLGNAGTFAANTTPAAFGVSDNIAPASGLLSGAAAPAAGASAAGGATGTLATIAKLAPLITQLMGGTKYPGTQSQSQIAGQQTALQNNQQQLNQGFQSALNAGNTKGPLRTQTDPSTDYYTYGSRPQQNFFSPSTPTQFPSVQTSPIQSLKKGGMPKANPSSNGRGGQDDNIRANLSEGEYVVPADVTSALGDGNTAGGASALQNMVKNVRQHKSSKGTDLPPSSKSPLQYMAGGGLPRPAGVHLRGTSSYVGG